MMTNSHSSRRGPRNRRSQRPTALAVGLLPEPPALATFFGVTFVYGLMLENGGIVMRFFYEPSFRLYLGPLPAPLCTMLGWCVVFRFLGRAVWNRGLLQYSGVGI